MISFLILFINVQIALAVNTDPALGQITTESSKQPSLVKVHHKISSQITKVASRLDLFFSNRKLMEGKNGSNIRLSSDHLFTGLNNNQSELTFKANLRLPMLQKKTQLSIERKSDDLDSQSPIATSTLPTERNRDEEQVRAGLSIFQRLKKVNSKLTFGAKITKPLIPFVNLRLSKESQLEKWRNNIINNMFYNTDEYFGQSLTVDFDRSISGQFMFRFTFAETYLESDNTTRTSIGPMIFHTLNSRQRIIYSLKLNASNRPAYGINEYYLGALFRHSFHKNFVFFEISPFIKWKRTLNFYAERAIYAKVEFIFGETYP